MHVSFHAQRLRISGFIPRCLNPRTVSSLGEIAVLFGWFKKTEFGTSKPVIESWTGFMCGILDDLASCLSFPGKQRIFFRMQMTNRRPPSSTLSHYATFEDDVLTSFRDHGILHRAAKIAHLRPFVVDGDLSTRFNERLAQEIDARLRYLIAIEPIARKQEQQAHLGEEWDGTIVEGAQKTAESIFPLSIHRRIIHKWLLCQSSFSFISRGLRRNSI